MPKLEVDLGEELFSFSSEQEWINKAQSWFAGCGVPRGHYLAIDAVGRVCIRGAEFMRATRDDTYPITVYMLQGD